MTALEQQRRRDLKRERKALDRAVTAGALPATSFAALPTRWNHARRARVASRSGDRSHREAAARIAEIQRELETVS